MNVTRKKSHTICRRPEKTGASPRDASYTVIRCPLYLEDEEREIQNEN